MRTAKARSRTVTAGEEFHLALKNTFSLKYGGITLSL